MNSHEKTPQGPEINPYKSSRVETLTNLFSEETKLAEQPRNSALVRRLAIGLLSFSTVTAAYTENVMQNWRASKMPRTDAEALLYRELNEAAEANKDPYGDNTGFLQVVEQQIKEIRKLTLSIDDDAP